MTKFFLLGEEGRELRLPGTVGLLIPIALLHPSVPDHDTALWLARGKQATITTNILDSSRVCMATPLFLREFIFWL